MFSENNKKKSTALFGIWILSLESSLVVELISVIFVLWSNFFFYPLKQGRGRESELAQTVLTAGEGFIYFPKRQ